MKVLLSAYACKPNAGSEPAVGWNLANALAAYCDVWVLTRESNRGAIEQALSDHPVARLQFVYFDLPRWLRFWKRGQHGLYLYYFLWQLGGLAIARKLHRAIRFDFVQHVTFVQFWTPSFLPLLGIPFIWGPVGGAEVTPWRFLRSLGVRDCADELARFAAISSAHFNPLVRMTARRSALALATTPATASRISRLGARRVKLMSQLALSESERAVLRSPATPHEPRIRIVSIGRLLPWKGTYLGLTAFARAGLDDAAYWIVGDGSDRGRLEALVRRLGIGDRVRMLGSLPRSETLHVLRQCDILLHPSLHDSGGWVCVEAMAAGKPVICLDLGGPATLISSSAGLCIRAVSPRKTVAAIADALSSLAGDPDRCRAMGTAGQSRAAQWFDWDAKARRLVDLYASVPYPMNRSESRVERRLHQRAALTEHGPRVTP